MSVQALARVQPIEVLDLIWPVVNAAIDTNTPAAFTASGYSKFGNAATTVWGQSTGTAGTMTFYREQIGALITNGQKGLDAIRCYMQVTDTLTTSPKYRPPEQFRVFRWDQLIAFTTANPGTTSGIAIVMGNANGSAPTYPLSAGNGAGFGIQGDGAGGVQWFSKPTIAGGFTDVTAIPLLGVPLTEVMAWSIELRAAFQGNPASVRVLLNGTQVISRPWGVGTVLPTYALATPMNHMRCGVSSGVAGDTVFMGPTHVLTGRFTIENVELLNPANGSI